MAATISPPPFFLLYLLPLLSLLTMAGCSSEADLLLAFRSSVEDPSGGLSGWSPAATHVCNWTGVTCSSQPGSAAAVTSLELRNLNLSGEISLSLCRLTRLSRLDLSGNAFNQPIPLHFSQCTSLQALNLSSNLMWGTLPDQISLLSSLISLDLSRNRIEGPIPPGLGALRRLQVLNLGSNSFTGTLHPSVLGNLTELIHLDLSQNPSLSSELPQDMGKLEKLQKVLMKSSGLYGNIPPSFLGLYHLVVLDLSQNNLSGSIPLGFGLGLAELVYLDLSQNKLSGTFPVHVCYGKLLSELSLHTNSFTGVLPGSLDKCSSLERLQLQNSGFSGDFPSGLWSLPKLTILRAENNGFSGEMPDSVRSASRLEQVQIDNNGFTGSIPMGLGMVSSLYRFSASLNGFHGELPDNFCDSPVMSIMNLSHNSLSGSIPSPRNCRKLVSLSLAGNHFTGEIPSSLAQLPVLTYIDLSDNDLTGGIPLGLQNLKLALFNVSFNQLSGEVPLSWISGLPASFLQGNPGLCGPGLPNPCGEVKHRRRNIGLICALTSMAFVVGVLLLAAGMYAKHRASLLRRVWGPLPASWKSVFYYPLRITEDDLLAGLNERNCVGRGSFGEVFMMQTPGGDVVAVKKLMCSSSLSTRSLRAEMKTLAKTRHKNVTKLLGFCHSEGFILLVYEFLPKGSLGDAISRSDFSLEWPIRLRIALGAARGLTYLHRDYVPKLLHRDIKSKNILLDVDFEPKVTDFGLDHIVGEASYQSSMASELGSFCYMAPEHGYSKRATEKMDVYSFGVVLLELITGRPAEQPESRGSLDVVKWVRRKINRTNGSFQILDPKISTSSQQEMLGALDLALRCTSVIPEKRPTMLEVVRSLQSLEPIVDPPPVLLGEFSNSSEH
uniref:non-specific serine/threonine protein kinase n=1 Tax=Anthurium amnicola TaxID=1678845 RepID=A0A1D1XUW2_9ARAE